MKRIGLIQVDGIMPNLALMKLHTFFKSKGREVVCIDLSTLRVDEWFASKVFVGGSGYDMKASLPKEIEEIVPDYDSFNLDYSLGFTSRGCMRNCDFCIVREKEGELHEVDMGWITKSKAIIMDNNFLASPMWRKKLEYFIEHKIKVNFNQGLDIRLIEVENAYLLLKTKSYDRRFRTRAYYFAFDDPSLESLIKEKVSLLNAIGFKSRWLLFYILVGHNTTHEEDIRRFEVVRDLGCMPYVMKYNDTKKDKWLNHFDRYVNRRYYQVMSMEEYKGGVLFCKNPSLLNAKSKGEL